MDKRSKQRSVRLAVQYSVEDIMVNLMLISIKIYKASFQPDNKKSPQKTKISLIRLIKQFDQTAKNYGNDDEAFSTQEIISDINDYRFDDAEYSTLQLRKSLSSLEVQQRRII